MPVRWTEPAETDFLNIYDRIAGTNPRVADRVAERLLTATRSLAGLPHRGRRGRLSGTRELVVIAYRTSLFTAFVTGDGMSQR